MSRETSSETKNDGWGQRLRRAHREWELSHDVRLTQGDLAEMFAEHGVRVTQQTVQRWLKGYEPKSLVIVMGVAKALGVSPGWLAFGEGPMRPNGEPPTISEEPDEEEPVPTTPPRRPKRRQA